MQAQTYRNAAVLLSLVAMSSFAASVLADEAAMIVAGTRLPQVTADLVPSTDVVTRSDIDTRQPRSPAELLRDLPGVWADQPGGPGSISSVYVRGGDPNFTLVLIDGVRVNDSTNSRGGSFDLSALSPDGIERLEIVRGARSAAYGSDALAGVINVVTLAGTDESSASVETGWGSEGYRRANARLSGPLKGARAALVAGVTDYGDPATDHQLIVRQANAKIETALPQNSKLNMFGRFAEAEAQSYPEESGGVLFAVRRTLERRDSAQGSGGVTFEHALGRGRVFELHADANDRSEVVTQPWCSTRSA